jgi:V/A-type H+-transporting ATPase subunit I
MIEKMNKLYLAIHSSAINEVLGSLQNLGVIHIEHQNLSLETSSDLLLLQSRIKDFIRYHANAKTTQLPHEGPVNALIDNHEHCLRELAPLMAQREKLRKALHEIAPWGHYGQKTIDLLEKQGLSILFYVLPSDQFSSLDLSKHTVEIISELTGKTYFVILKHKNDPSPAIEPIPAPEMDASEIKWQIERIDSNIAKLKERLAELSQYVQALSLHVRIIQDKFSFQQAVAGLENHEAGFAIMTGWVPSSSLGITKEFLMSVEHCAFSIEENLVGENPAQIPIKLKNSFMAKVFEPITKLFSLPQYTEMDLTPLFAPFFAMFFGICLGDTGYGILLMASTAFIFKRFPKFRLYAVLGFLFGVSTTFWGILTGTTFGMNLFEIKIPVLSNFAVLPSEHMFYFALLIGLFQILFGFCIQMVNKARQGGLMSSLSTLGWLLIIPSVCVLYLATQPVNPDNPFYIGRKILEFSHWLPRSISLTLCCIGIFNILVLNNFQSSIPVRIGKGLWELYGITGFFGDLLSYMRLFALGMSSAVLGTVINAMGLAILNIPIPGLSHVLCILFLVLGHTGNFLLSMLGSFVHPLRLTFVEFYKNAGFSGGGRAYTPFKKEL